MVAAVEASELEGVALTVAVAVTQALVVSASAVWQVRLVAAAALVRPVRRECYVVVLTSFAVALFERDFSLLAHS